jgi:hypothetical protein
VAASPGKKINFNLMSETPFDSQIIELEGTNTVPFKLNDKSTQEYIFENFMIDNGQEQLNGLSKMPSTFAFIEQEEVYDYIADKLNFKPATLAEQVSDSEEKRVGIFGRVKNRVKKVYKFFGNRLLGKKAESQEEENQAEIDMDIAANNQGIKMLQTRGRDEPKGKKKNKKLYTNKN